MSQPVKADNFSHKRFVRKLTQAFKAAGFDVIEKALWLYYAAQRPDIPKWATVTVYSALAYFILPMDIIPDFIPISGYVDDMGVLLAAISTIASYIDNNVKTKANAKLRTLGLIGR